MKQKPFSTLIFFVFLLTSCVSPDTHPVISEDKFPLSEAWSTTLEHQIYGVAILDDWIAVGKSYGIESINAKTGNAMWNLSFPLDTGSLLLFSDGYLITADSSQIKVIERSGKEAVTINMDPKRDRANIIAAYANYVFVVRVPSYILEVYNIKTGAIAWEKLVERGGVNINFDFDTNTVFITTSRFIGAYHTSDGSMIWEINQIVRTSTLDQGILYYYAITLEDEDTGHIIAVDSQNSNQLWQVDIPLGNPTAVYNLTVLNNALIASTDLGLLAIDKKDGHSLWQSETNDFFYGKPVLVNNVIYVRGTTSSLVYAISPEDGHYLGYLSLGESSLISLAQREYDLVYATDEALFFPYENTIYSYFVK